MSADSAAAWFQTHREQKRAYALARYYAMKDSKVPYANRQQSREANRRYQARVRERRKTATRHMQVHSQTTFAEISQFELRSHITKFLHLPCLSK